MGAFSERTKLTERTVRDAKPATKKSKVATPSRGTTSTPN
jgi:hypothetical protein